MIKTLPMRSGFKIDWLTISFREACGVSADELLEVVSGILGIKPEERFVLKDKGMSRGYNRSYCYLGNRNLSINFHDKNLYQGTLINITGQGINIFENDELIALLKYSLQKNAYFTRLDVAFDDFDELFPIHITEKIIDDELLSSHVSSFFNDVTFTYYGHTSPKYKGRKYRNFSYGSRQSMSMLRLYNKAIEQKMEDYWLRLEFQLKYENAEHMVNCILSGQIAQGFIYFLNRYFRVLDFTSTNSNHSCIATHKDWQHFLDVLLDMPSLLPQINI